MRTIQKPLALALASALLAMATGCGGDDNDDSPSPPPPPPPTEPTPVTLRGAVMVNQAVRNAVVCMDLNANSACDVDEPASARTDANGAYSLTYDASKISPSQVATAQLIAPLVPGAVDGPDTAMDAANPGAAATTRAYVLRQVPGKSGQINPLTTLVATGMAAGMDEGAARTHTAQQLGIAQAKIDNYQDDPALDLAQLQDNARTLAVFSASALANGAALQVGNPVTGSDAAADVLSTLFFTDAANYDVTVFGTPARAAGSTERTNTEMHSMVIEGVPVTDVRRLYPSIYLTPSGWKRCDGTTVHPGTLGNPSRSTYCETQQSIAYQTSIDIAGQPMAQVINTLQTDPASNPINRNMSTSALLAAVGSATFPAGSQVLKNTRLLLAPPLFVTDTANQLIPPQVQASTLEQLVAARPASGVNLADGAGTLSLGLSTSPLRNLRVAFTGMTSATDGTVQFYDCDLDAAEVVSNCSATNTGTYHIDTVNGVRVMRFAGHAPTTGSSQNNFYAEVKGTSTGDRIARVRQAKPVAQTMTSYRLNGTAWTALKTQLGL